MSKEREAFVEKYRKVYKVDKSLFVNDSGEFTDLFCQDAWVMWQAAKAQAVPEVLKKFCNEHKDPAWRGRLTEYDKGYSDCCIVVLEMIEAQQPSSTPDCPDEP